MVLYSFEIMRCEISSSTDYPYNAVHVTFVNTVSIKKKYMQKPVIILVRIVNKSNILYFRKAMSALNRWRFKDTLEPHVNKGLDNYTKTCCMARLVTTLFMIICVQNSNKPQKFRVDHR